MHAPRIIVRGIFASALRGFVPSLLGANVAFQGGIADDSSSRKRMQADFSI
jgi:hypothetical protein